MLGLYHLGNIRRLDFGSHWTVAVGRKGLSLFLLSDIFRAWVKMLYRVVEVQNAVRHDYGILNAVTVAGDRADDMTLLKAQLLLEAHQRFLTVYIPSLLGAGFAELWAMTAGLCAPDEDARRATARMDEASRSAAADSAAEWLTGLSAQVRALGDAAAAAREQALGLLLELRGVLEGADMRFLGSVKELVRERGPALRDEHARGAGTFRLRATGLTDGDSRSAGGTTRRIVPSLNSPDGTPGASG